MEDLPTPVLVDILSRLGCSTDLASCRLACRTFRSLSYKVRAVRLFCSRARLIRSGDAAVAPFKSLVYNLATLLHGYSSLESLSLSVQRDLDDDDGDDVEERGDLHLTSDGFVSQWLPILAPKLLELSISDHWPQSCWRKSLVLACISSFCQMLKKLEIKYAWLSVDELKPLPTLTALTLEFIRLDDSQLNIINESFPSLEVLKLIYVGGLDKPKICLAHLRCCYWTATNIPSELTIEASSLVELNLRCVKPKKLILRTPLLSTLNLRVDREVRTIESGSLVNLEFLRIESWNIGGLIQGFQGCHTVRNLEIVVPFHKALPTENVSLKDLVRSFPGLNRLKLSPGIWCKLDKSFVSVHKWRSLRKLAMPLDLFEVDSSLASHMVDMCPLLFKVDLLAPNHVSESQKTLLSTFTKRYRKVTWELVSI